MKSLKAIKLRGGPKKLLKIKNAKGKFQKFGI